MNATPKSFAIKCSAFHPVVEPRWRVDNAVTIVCEIVLKHRAFEKRKPDSIRGSHGDYEGCETVGCTLVVMSPNPCLREFSVFLVPSLDGKFRLFEVDLRWRLQKAHLGREGFDLSEQVFFPVRFNCHDG